MRRSIAAQRPSPQHVLPQRLWSKAQSHEPGLRIGATGFALIAVCYGFARFAFGLFLPQIDAELGLGASLSGMISGGSFAGYCIAIIASAALTEWIGARAVVVTAALVAAFGMAAIALAPSPLILLMAVVVAGSSTGLASPQWQPPSQ